MELLLDTSDLGWLRTGSRRSSTASVSEGRGLAVVGGNDNTQHRGQVPINARPFSRVLETETTNRKKIKLPLLCCACRRRDSDG